MLRNISILVSVLRRSSEEDLGAGAGAGAGAGVDARINILIQNLISDRY